MRSKPLNWRLFLCAVLALAVSLLAACGSDAAVNTADDETSDVDAEGSETLDDGGEPIPIDLDALSANTWTLRFGGGPDGEISVIDGWPITITFDSDTLAGGTFGGTAACNDYGGTYDIDGSEIFLGDEITSNAMGCEPDVQALEEAFFKALRDVDGINLIGDEMALSGMSTELIFAATDLASITTEDEAPNVMDSPKSDAELLDGTEWVFVGGDSPDGPIADPRTIDPAASISLTFTIDTYSGTVICNNYEGDADIGISLWTFALGVPEVEEEDCYDELDGVPEAYLDALPFMNEGGIENEGQRLVMNGNEIELHFERAE